MSGRYRGPSPGSSCKQSVLEQRAGDHGSQGVASALGVGAGWGLVRVAGNEPGARATAPSGTWALFGFASDSAQLPLLYCRGSACLARDRTLSGSGGEGCVSTLFGASLRFPARPGHEHAGASGVPSRLRSTPDDHFYPSRVRLPEGWSADHRHRDALDLVHTQTT